MGELGIDKFEVVGLGGDDVFMIVPANRAVEFAVKLAKKYKEKFEELYGSRHFKGALSTMSVGIAVGRYDIPVKILLEQAEIKLDEAKSYSKKRTHQDDGSVSFAMHTDYDNSLTVKSVGGMTDTMKPYSIENAEKLLGFICELKTNKISKARLRNILDAYRNAESIEESDLFFEYVNAKEASLNKRIRLCPMNGYELSGGHYTKDGKLFYIWKDILELYE
jgi:hypothetical protein